MASILHVVAIWLTLLTLANAGSLDRENFDFSLRNSSSCQGRCNSGLQPGAPCQCNSACTSYNDCCSDYIELCVGTCNERCGSGLDPGAICQCNTACQNYDDCCPDYEDLCGDVTDDELRIVAEELITLDVNNVAQFVTVNVNQRPLLQVNPAAYLKPTIARLVALFDNYYPEVTRSEYVTAEELREEIEFLDAVFATSVMQRAQLFLAENGLPNGRDNLYKIWFGLYNRGGGTLSSSGFEHVFAGELMNGVSGFHNWLYFAQEEANGNLGNIQIADLLTLGTKGWVMENSFTWLNQTKPIGGGFIATSPEFELAIYTICYHSRPNALCPVSLNGQRFHLQTYETGASHSVNDTFISTTYTVI